VPQHSSQRHITTLNTKVSSAVKLSIAFFIIVLGIAAPHLTCQYLRLKKTCRGKRSSIFFLSIYKEKSILALTPADRISQSRISIIKTFLFVTDTPRQLSSSICTLSLANLIFTSLFGVNQVLHSGNLKPAKTKRSSLFRPSVTNKINVFMTLTPDLRVLLTNFVAEIFRLRKKWPHPRRGCSGGRGSKGCDPANFNVKRDK